MRYYPSHSFRRPNQDDALSLWNWRNRDNIRQIMFNNQTISWEEHQKWFEKLLDENGLDFWIFRQNDEPIGVLSFTHNTIKKLNLGFYIGKENCWPGTGLVLESAALDYVANKKKEKLLCAEVLSSNQSVIRLHEFFGFKVVDTKVDFLERDGLLLDKITMEILLQDWCERRDDILSKFPTAYRLAIDSTIFESDR